MSEKISDLPNIGKVLEEKLNAVGIKDVSTLKTVGSVEAFKKIQCQVDSGACDCTLFALEGAIQGIRWHELDKEYRNILVKKARG